MVTTLAVSVSLGSSTRDRKAVIRIGDCDVQIERIGVNGDLEAAAEKFRELEEGLGDDGAATKVACFGVGGTNLGAYIEDVYYPFKSIEPMVRYIQSTPIVDGSGVKHTVEANMAAFLQDKLGQYIEEHGGKKVFVACAIDRWELSMSFVHAGYDFVFGDLMFALGIPIPIRSLRIGIALAKILVPLTTRYFPFEWLYPVGEQQNVRKPAYVNHYKNATVIAGDCHYILQHMPTAESGIMRGKIVVTNTTTAKDVQEFREAGVKYLVTSTPSVTCSDSNEQRTFGTNLLEAALVAAAGLGRTLSWEELKIKLKEMGMEPCIQELN